MNPWIRTLTKGIIALSTPAHHPFKEKKPTRQKKKKEITVTVTKTKKQPLQNAVNEHTHKIPM